MSGDYADVGRTLGLEVPRELERLWSNPPAAFVSRMYGPRAPHEDRMSLDAALRSLRTSHHVPWPGLVPVTYVDERSLACVVCETSDGASPVPTGYVVRWHLADIAESYQPGVLDVDVTQYARSLVEEHERSDAGYDGMVRVSRRYQTDFALKGVTPKSWDRRPFQLACQNVIIGLAAMRYDATIDGQLVEYWQTCEAPHVATNEGSRALAALMLCDAFQSGGTMEIDFRSHPEGRVPAALRRYGRVVGIGLGEDTPTSISPREARQLFIAVTTMPPRLREAVTRVTDAGVASPERLCYSLLAPIWPAIELEFMLRCSNRAGSILHGGANVEDRRSRLHELEICRAASMAGMLFRRLDSRDPAGGSDGGDVVRVFEGRSHGVSWRVLDDYAAVEFSGVPVDRLPWQVPGSEALVVGEDRRFLALPRAHPLVCDCGGLAALTDEVPVVVVAPRDADFASLGFPILRCPDRLSDIDARIERNLQLSRVTRA